MALVDTVTGRRRESVDERQTNKQIHIRAHLRCCLLRHEIQSLYITSCYYKRAQLGRLHVWLDEQERMLTPFSTLLIHQMRLFPECNIVLDVAHWHLKNEGRKKSSSHASQTRESTRSSICLMFFFFFRLLRCLRNHLCFHLCLLEER